jgi:hypothetical protein
VPLGVQDAATAVGSYPRKAVIADDVPAVDNRTIFSATEVVVVFVTPISTIRPFTAAIPYREMIGRVLEPAPVVIPAEYLAITYVFGYQRAPCIGDC